MKTAIRLGQILDMEIVAEGIESKKIMEELYQLGCDYGQGYYFSKPLPKRDFIDFYNNWKNKFKFQ